MTASTVATGTVATAASARTVQLAIQARLMQDAAKLWPMLDAKRLAETFPGWSQAMALLIRSYHGQSATAAGRFYQSARAAAIHSPTPLSLIVPVPAPSDDWLTRALGFSGPGMLSRDTVQPGTALSTTLGTASRLALDGGRSTIVETANADPVAVGWYRTTDGSPCAFCALLAARPVMKGRGSLYRTRESAGFQAHNACGCSAAPFFHIDQELPAINQQAAEVYRNRGKGPALKAFRRAWADHTGAQTA